MRRPGQRVPAGPRGGAARTRIKSFAAPTKGWVSAQNLAAAVPGTALVLENWYPTQKSIRLRAGSRKHATVGTEPVESLMSYVGSLRKMFAACDGSVYEVTTVADPDVPPAAEFSGQTSNYYSYTNFATTAGLFMYIVNGTDSARLYNGTAWTTITGVSVPAITGVTTSTLIHVWTYRNRLFFIQSGTMTAWALPVGSLGGAAIQINLGGVFKRGGTLKLGATWSLDSGDGLDDKCVFITTEGEIAIYEGSDPSTTTDWSIVGRYDFSPAMGKNATMQAGGDLLVATEQGFIPVSAAVNRDPAALPLAGVSQAIQPDWISDAAQRRSMPWEIAKWTTRGKAIISTPVTGDTSTTPPQCYVVNLETGAWCKYTGWDTRCLTVHEDFVYFGTNDGTIMQAEITGADDGNIIYHNCVLSFDHFDRVGFYKTAIEMRATFITQNDFNPKLSVSVDYQVSLASAPDAASDTVSPGVWDQGLWDVAKWDAGAVQYNRQTYWVGVGLSGTVHAPQVQVTSGSEQAPSAELVILDVKIDDGDDTGS